MCILFQREWYGNPFCPMLFSCKVDIAYKYCLENKWRTFLLCMLGELLFKNLDVW